MMVPAHHWHLGNYSLAFCAGFFDVRFFHGRHRLQHLQRCVQKILQRVHVFENGRPQAIGEHLPILSTDEFNVRPNRRRVDDKTVDATLGARDFRNLLTELFARLEIFVPIVARLQVHIAQVFQIHVAQNDERSPSILEFAQFVEKRFTFLVQHAEAIPISANQIIFILIGLSGPALGE